jgi:hypothetical protein
MRKQSYLWIILITLLSNTLQYGIDAEKMLNHIISSRVFNIAGIPILLLFIGVFARRLGRRDGDDSPRLNDWAVGTPILLMVFSTILSDLRNITNPNDIPDHLMIFIGIMFTAFMSIDHDRYRPWKRDNNGFPLKEKNLFHGIILPNFVCVSVFGLYQAYKIGAL